MNNVPWTPFLVAAVPAVLADLMKTEEVPIRRLIAAVLYGALLWGLVGWRNDVGMAFAWVGAIASLLVNGPTLFAAIGKVID